MKNYIKLAVLSAILVVFAIITRVVTNIFTQLLSLSVGNNSFLVNTVVNVLLVVALALFTLSSMLWTEDAISYAKKMDL